MASIGFSKVFILDKYFSELQKFWETEKKLQGMKVEDSISSPEAAHLELRLKTLSTELVTLRNRLHVNINNPSRTNSARINPAPIPNGYNKPLPVPPQQPVADYVNQLPKDVDLVQSCPSSKRSGSMIGTRTTSSARSESSTSSSAGQVLTDVDDLIHLPGPLTEDAIIKCLHNRSARGEYFVSMGQILLLGNPQTLHNNPLTLHSTQSIPPPSSIQRVVQEALRQQAETNYPQAIILSGWSGSGKTYTSMLILRELFKCAGGGADGFKHLSAAITVLRSLGSASTAVNKECSRIGHFIEVQVSDGTLYRTKVHCYFLDQSRVVKCSQDEKNYHIFYQLMAGLNPEERTKLHLDTHTINTLRYLRSTRKWDETDDAGRFAEWKACLGTLGIPFLDVVRVLAAVLLLGNISFIETCREMELLVEDQVPLSSAAALLGVSETALRQGLTTRTHNARSQMLRSRCSANISNSNRDALAKSLYCRTLATIVRRANSSKRMDSATSSDSTDSVHHDVASQHASTVGTAGSKASKSMTALNNAVRHCQDGFIGILDMFGFEAHQPSSLEQLCINLSAETMQHFYNTHIFKACLESCRDEGISCDWEVDYADNVPCIDLISSLKTGLLSMLDVECSVNGSVENYIQKVHVQHSQNPRLTQTGAMSFAVQHFAGKVIYDATMFTDTNRDILPDDLVAVFHKHRCSFGFASHLFSSELKILGAGGIEPSPKGINFRISPTSHSEMLNGLEPLTTLTQDFHTRLDNLLRTLVHARPHFIRCIKMNENNFDRLTVSKQLRSFQVLESLNLMVNGYPHRMRFKGFMSRYKLLGGVSNGADDCVAVLEKHFKGHNWAVGKKHVFLSEVTRQELECLRSNKINGAATLIQSMYRGWIARKRNRMPSPIQDHSAQMFIHAAISPEPNSRPRPQPITGTPPPDEASSSEIKPQSTTAAFDMGQNPPPLPVPRSYTINGNLKISFPQVRVMKMLYVHSSGLEVNKGESVVALGTSPQRRGHLIVEYKNRNIQIPHQYLQVQVE